jgi:hypothetical protein
MQMECKWSADGVQMECKWSTKWSANGVQMECKWSTNGMHYVCLTSIGLQKKGYQRLALFSSQTLVRTIQE